MVTSPIKRKKERVKTHVEIFQENLDYVLERKGITPKEAYFSLGVAYSTWHSWFTRDSLPHHKLWPKIEELFEVKMWMLLHPQMVEMMERRK